MKQTKNIDRSFKHLRKTTVIAATAADTTLEKLVRLGAVVTCEGSLGIDVLTFDPDPDSWKTPYNAFYILAVGRARVVDEPQQVALFASVKPKTNRTTLEFNDVCTSSTGILVMNDPQILSHDRIWIVPTYCDQSAAIEPKWATTIVKWSTLVNAQGLYEPTISATVPYPAHLIVTFDLVKMIAAAIVARPPV